VFRSLTFSSINSSSAAFFKVAPLPFCIVAARTRNSQRSINNKTAAKKSVWQCANSANQQPIKHGVAFCKRPALREVTPLAARVIRLSRRYRQLTPIMSDWRRELFPPARDGLWLISGDLSTQVGSIGTRAAQPFICRWLRSQNRR